tara:strand:+ start:228 stop:518 length:291 start_codon:yes stop_codon:yes gene_type:complete
MEQLRLIANPHLLANEKQVSKTKIIIPNNFQDKLHQLINSEYNDIYIPESFTMKVFTYIHSEINNMMIDRIVEDCIDKCIQDVIRRNKFDFLIPFD